MIIQQEPIAALDMEMYTVAYFHVLHCKPRATRLGLVRLPLSSELAHAVGKQDYSG